MSVIDWHGFDAWVLESETVRVVIIPQLGSKIVSLQDLTAGYEWLAPPTRPLRTPTYGDVFIDYDLSGWDEMFPTITLCSIPGASEGQLPDHGEVWALPWEVLYHLPDSLTTRVGGKQAAYRYSLTRKASLTNNTLRLEYHLENQSARDLPFLWAAHPLFNGDEDTEIQLPQDVQTVVNTADHPAMGPPDREVTWPTARLLTSGEQALNRVGDATLQDYRKLYTQPSQPVGTASLLQHGVDRRLDMRWDVETAPYLGIWVDEGTHTRSTTVALEPASGYYDKLEDAVQNQRVAEIGAGETYTWWLEVSLGPI